MLLPKILSLWVSSGIQEVVFLVSYLGETEAVAFWFRVSYSVLVKHPRELAGSSFSACRDFKFNDTASATITSLTPIRAETAYNPGPPCHTTGLQRKDDTSGLISKNQENPETSPWKRVMGRW